MGVVKHNVREDGGGREGRGIHQNCWWALSPEDLLQTGRNQKLQITVHNKKAVAEKVTKKRPSLKERSCEEKEKFLGPKEKVY